MTVFAEQAGSSFPRSGKVVTFTVTSDGALVDPSDLHVDFGKCVPGQMTIDETTIVSYDLGIGAEIVRLSQGRYRIKLLPTSSGWWGIRIVSDGSYLGAEEVYFRVLDSHFDAVPV